MGAATFTNIGRGINARAAFNSVTQEAQHEHGHGGYSGSIAEKGSFVIIPDSEVKEIIRNVDHHNKSSLKDLALAAANFLMDNDDDRISDKWGPAGCIKVKDGEYLFFGWAPE